MTTYRDGLARDGVNGEIQMNNRNATLTGRDIGCYNTVSGHVTVVNNHGDNTSDSIRIASWLRSPSINYKLIHDETCSLRVPQTIGWFFDVRAYKDWVEGAEGKHLNLQCIGMPGAGKTVLASAVIEDLEKRSRLDDARTPPRMVLYVYFKHDRQSIQTRKIILANLLSQLVQKQQHPSTSVLALFEEYRHDLTLIPMPEKTINILKSEIASGVLTYIVVDALDEFSLRDPSSALALVRDLEGLNAKLLITSRYEVGFTSSISTTVYVTASLADMHTFIEQQVSSSPRLKRFIARSPELRSHVLEQVTAKAQGIKVRAAVQNLPSGTTAMYELTMDRVESQQDSDLKQLGMYALSWVLFAKRRLRMKELQHAVAFELQDRDEMVDDDDLYELEDIISACAGLIICVDDEVQFVHFTTQEFLNKNCDRYLPDAKLRITNTCLRYLIALAPLIPDHPRDDQDPYYRSATDDPHPQYPFANYALWQWGIHAADIDGQEPPNTVYLVNEFFQLPSLSTYLTTHGLIPSAQVPPGPRLGLWRTPPGVSTLTYKLLFFAAFGLCSLLKRCLEDAKAGEVDLNRVCDGSGYTPLFFATSHHRLAMVGLLLDKGADVTMADVYGSTPLHHAASLGLVDLVTIFLQQGADVDARDKSGKSAIVEAVRENELEMVRMLIEHAGADIDTSDEKGKTLLHQAAHGGNSDIVTFLLERGMDINAADEDGCTPIWEAIREEKIEMVKLLMVERKGMKETIAR